MPSATYWGSLVLLSISGEAVMAWEQVLDVEAHALEGEIAEEVVDFLQVVLGNAVGIFRIDCLADQDQRVRPVGAADIAVAEHGAEGKIASSVPSWSWCIMAVVWPMVTCRDRSFFSLRKLRMRRWR